MAKVVDYDVCAQSTIEDLIDEVCDMVKQGWRPAGGICTNGYNNVWAQAMMKYEPEVIIAIEPKEVVVDVGAKGEVPKPKKGKASRS